MATSIRFALLVLGAAAGTLGSFRQAAAAGFAVNPTTITLSTKQMTRLLSLNNSGDAAVRFQLSVYEWRQGLDGGTELIPTRDIILFPLLLTIQPGAARSVRIGATVAASTVERNYRVIVEELPPPPDAGNTGAGLTVRTRMSIPIFVRPPVLKAQATIAEFGFTNGQATFRVNNTGTVHFLVNEVSLRGLDATGQEVVYEKRHGWYVLAATGRLFTVAVDPAACGRLASIVVHAKIGETTLTDRLVSPSAACGRPSP